jgi:hypothetical protein
MTYTPHTKVTVPSANTVIWRYVDLPRFVSMLETKSLWFSSIAVLAKDDQWEASFPRRARDMWREQSGCCDRAPDEEEPEAMEKSSTVAVWAIGLPLGLLAIIGPFVLLGGW